MWEAVTQRAQQQQQALSADGHTLGREGVEARPPWCMSAEDVRGACAWPPTQPGAARRAPPPPKPATALTAQEDPNCPEQGSSWHGIRAAGSASLSAADETRYASQPTAACPPSPYRPGSRSSGTWAPPASPPAITRAARTTQAHAAALPPSVMAILYPEVPSDAEEGDGDDATDQPGDDASPPPPPPARSGGAASAPSQRLGHSMMPQPLPPTRCPRAAAGGSVPVLPRGWLLNTHPHVSSLPFGAVAAAAAAAAMARSASPSSSFTSPSGRLVTSASLPAPAQWPPTAALAPAPSSPAGLGGVTCAPSAAQVLFSRAHGGGATGLGASRAADRAQVPERRSETLAWLQQQQQQQRQGGGDRQQLRTRSFGTHSAWGGAGQQSRLGRLSSRSTDDVSGLAGALAASGPPGSSPAVMTPEQSASPRSSASRSRPLASWASEPSGALSAAAARPPTVRARAAAGASRPAVLRTR